MAFTMEELKKLPMRLGDFLGSDAAPVVLGQAGAAFTAKDPTSWQHQLGKAAAGWGQSKVAATAAKEQAQERAQLQKALIDVLGGNIKYTPDTEDGPTTSSFKTSPDGKQTITLQGRGMLGGPTVASNFPSNRNLGGANAAQPTTPTPKPARPVQPNAAPPQGQALGGMLPLQLAQAVGGSAGGGSNLFGLSPEQIQAVTRSDIMGQEVLGRGTTDIFRNLVDQAQSQYMGQRPAIEAYKAMSANQLAQRKQQLDAMRMQAQNARDYANVAKIDAELRMLEPEFMLKQREANARISNLKSTTAATDQRTSARKILMESGLRPEDLNAGAIIAAGGSASDITAARRWQSENASNIAQMRSKLLTEFADDKEVESVANFVNQAAPDDSTSFVAWGTKGDNDWREIPLPKVEGQQMTMNDARITAQEEGVPLKTFLDDVYKQMEARGMLP